MANPTYPLHTIQQAVVTDNPWLPMNIATKEYVDTLVGGLVAPINKHVPAVYQEGAVLSCTMGEWTGDPDTYAYQWQLDAVDAGTDSGTYDVLPADVGKSATCTVTATNPRGSTTAPPSNAVVIA